MKGCRALFVLGIKTRFRLSKLLSVWVGDCSSVAPKAAVLRSLRAIQAQGFSLPAMADRFNTEGVPTLSAKGRWQKGTIGKLLRAHRATLLRMKRRDADEHTPIHTSHRALVLDVRATHNPPDLDFGINCFFWSVDHFLMAISRGNKT
jgi:hypothetical protein